MYKLIAIIIRNKIYVLNLDEHYINCNFITTIIFIICLSAIIIYIKNLKQCKNSKK